MKPPEFDKFAQNYDNILEATIPEGLNEERYFAEYKVALMSDRLKRNPPHRILDFGCGSGRSLPFLQVHFPTSELWGYDVSLESLKIAKSRVPQAHLFSEWKSVSNVEFDAIIAANVFHHIPLKTRMSALRQCYNTLAEQGSLFLFEHNPYNPVTRWVFERCPLDVDAEMINLREAKLMSREAGFTKEKYGYTMFFPRPLAALRKLEPYLSWLPLGAQYCIQMMK